MLNLKGMKHLMYLKHMVYEPYRQARKRLLAPFNKYEHWRRVAQAIHLSPPARRRLEWLIFYHSKAEKNASLTIRHFSLNRSTFYYWLKRFDEANLRTLESQITAPRRTRQPEITTSQEQRAIHLRKQHLYWGKVKLAKIYQEEYGEKLSSWQFQRLIKKYHLYPQPTKNKRIQAKRQRANKKKRITELKIKLPYLGFLLHFDTIEIYWNGTRRYIITAIDHFTKIAFARMYSSKNSHSSSDFLLRVNYLLDGKINIAHRDNGAEFQKHFQRLGEKLGIKQYFSRPHTPKDNPSMERFNQTLQREWLNNGNFTPNIELFNSRLKEFILEYNFKRPHETLNYLTPIQFAVKYKQLSERYSSDTVKDCATECPLEDEENGSRMPHEKMN